MTQFLIINLLVCVCVCVWVCVCVYSVGYELEGARLEVFDILPSIHLIDLIYPKHHLCERHVAEC